MADTQCTGVKYITLPLERALHWINVTSHARGLNLSFFEFVLSLKKISFMKVVLAYGVKSVFWCIIIISTLQIAEPWITPEMLGYANHGNFTNLIQATRLDCLTCYNGRNNPVCDALCDPPNSSRDSILCEVCNSYETIIPLILPEKLSYLELWSHKFAFGRYKFSTKSHCSHTYEEH